MSNNKLIRNIGLVASVVGAIVAIFGYYKLNAANSMAEAISNIGYSASTLKSYNIWDNRAKNYKIVLIVGLIILVVGIILFVSGIVSMINSESAAKLNTNNIDENNINNTSNINKTISEKLKELDDLKGNGLITEDEYNEQRKKIISSI